MKSGTFQRVLEIIEALTEEEREALIQIVNKRLIDERRDRLAQSIKEAREEFSRGEFAKGTVDDLMGELSK